jgi:heptosyltransferase-2
MIYNSVLIIRIDRIGDVLLSTAVIQAVRQANPNAYVAFMTRPFTKDIVIGNPYLDEVILYDKDGAHGSIFGTILFAVRLRQRKFDLALVLHPSVRANWIAFLAAIPRRVGHDKKAPWLLTKRLPYLNHEGAKHEMEYILDVARAAGILCEDKNLRPFMPIGREAEDFISRFLDENGVGRDDKLLAIHATASCPSKTWPCSRFSEVADRLIDQTGCKVVIEDIKAADTIQDGMKHKAIILKDSTLQQAAALFKRCRFLISTDNGLAHIAGALDVPCISIFGRKQPGLSPVRWRPLAKDVTVLHKDVGCPQCLAHNCKKHFACLEAVTVDEVLDAAKKFL